MNDANVENPLVLAIETATRAGSVAVARGKTILSSATGDASVSHSSNLIEMIQASCAKAGVKLSEIDLFAAATGPGSFTGLRIGLATIKGFAACLNRKVASISTLAAIAHSAGESNVTVSVLPAGRGEVFAQMFSVSDSDVTSLDNASHLTPEKLSEKYREANSVKWAGDMERVFGVFDLGESNPPEGAPPNNLAISVAA